MIDNTASASSLPIKDEAELNIEARANQLYNEHDFASIEEARQYARAEARAKMPVEKQLQSQHEETGMPADRAARHAQNQVRVYGEAGARQYASENETPAGRARRQKAWAETQQDDARHQRMYDQYFRDTAAPGYQNIPAEEVARDEYNQRWGQLYDSYRADGLNVQQPIDPGTPEQNARWNQFLKDNPEATARYRPDEFAAQQKAESDRQWEQRRPMLVRRYGEEEVAKMEEARSQGRTYTPYNREQRENNQAQEDRVSASMQGSTDARRELKAQEDRRRQATAPQRMIRLRVQAGLAGQTQHPAYNDESLLRELIAGNREATRQGRDEAWRVKNMLRAGNALPDLARRGQGDWLNAAVVGGPTPLDVEARQADRAAAMAQQSLTAFLANNPAATPEQRRLAEMQLAAKENELPVETHAQVERDRNEGVLPANSPAGLRMLKKIEDEVIGWFWATPSEVDRAVEEAVRAGVPRPDAEAYFQKRRGTGAGPASAPAAPASPRPPAVGPGSGSPIK